MSTYAACLWKVGAQGPQVARLQDILNCSPPPALPPLLVDGKFGPRTRARVIEVQRYLQIPADGVIGPQTLDRIAATPKAQHDIYTSVRRMLESELAASPVVLARYDSEWNRLRSALIPVNAFVPVRATVVLPQGSRNALSVPVAVGIAILFVFLLAMVALMQDPRFKKFTREAGIRFQRLLDEFRDGLNLPSPGQLLKHVLEKAADEAERVMQDVNAKRKKCEEEVARRQAAKKEPMPKCDTKKIHDAMKALSERIFVLRDIPLRSKFDQGDLLRGLFKAMNAFLDAAKAWFDCMNCGDVIT